MGFIKMNYTEMLSDADRLAGLANMGEEYLREMRNIGSSIPSVWTGEASNAFVNLCIQGERELKDLINTLDNISSNLRTIASDIKAADERAKMVIENSSRAIPTRNSSKTKT